MSTSLLPLEPKPLSQVERVVDAYVAPSKTFSDLLRSAAWWLPCLLVLACGVATLEYTVQKVGVSEMTEGMIRRMPKLQSQIESAPPDQAARIRASMNKRNQGNVYSIPIGLLVGGFVTGALFLAVANFAFGGTAKYMQLVAVFWYSQLPLIVFDILLFILFGANVGTENYNPLNPAGTNLGYYFEGVSPVVGALLGSIDIFSIWIFALQVIGVGRVARIKTSSAVIAVGLCWVVYIGVFKVLPLALFS